MLFVVSFIVYGSLFPFDFVEAPESVAKLLSRTSLFESRADALDNFLLFIPLGFALHASLKDWPERIAAALLALMVLGLGLQYAQLYLPSRTASMADVFWNGVGLGAGSLVAVVLRQWYERVLASSTNANVYPLILVMLWFCYESFPFVPTLDIGLLREHIKSAVFAPPFDPMRFLQHLLAALACGVAVQRTNLFRPSGISLALVGSCAFALEILVAYGSLRRETLLGMALGLLGGYVIGRSNDKVFFIALALISSAMLVLTIVTPYRGQASDGAFTLTPFSNFLWRSVTFEIPPLAFEALALGGLLWAWLKTPMLRNTPVVGFGFAFAVVAFLEALRVFVFGFHGDTTTLVIFLLLAPFAMNQRPLRETPSRHRVAVRPSASPQYEERIRFKPSRPRPAFADELTLGITIIILAAAIYLVARLPGMPYNIQELLPNGIPGIIAAVCLASALYLVMNAPFFLLGADSRLRVLLFPLLLFLQGVLVWTLLRAGVALESMHDIVGSPVLGWPGDTEILLRFVALHQAVATHTIGAVLLVAAIARPQWIGALAYWLLVSLLLAWPLHAVVVDAAATDNLTELMRDNAAFLSSALLSIGFFCIALGGTALSAALVMASRRWALLALSLISAPLAATCLAAGMETVIIKYDKVFSAAQFLLSPDRKNYLPESQLLPRFILAYAAATASIALLQLPGWQRWVSRHRA